MRLAVNAGAQARLWKSIVHGAIRLFAPRTHEERWPTTACAATGLARQKKNPTQHVSIRYIVHIHVIALWLPSPSHQLRTSDTPRYIHTKGTLNTTLQYSSTVYMATSTVLYNPHKKRGRDCEPSLARLPPPRAAQAHLARSRWDEFWMRQEEKVRKRRPEVRAIDIGLSRALRVEYVL